MYLCHVHVLKLLSLLLLAFILSMLFCGSVMIAQWFENILELRENCSYKPHSIHYKQKPSLNTYAIPFFHLSLLSCDWKYHILYFVHSIELQSNTLIELSNMSLLIKFTWMTMRPMNFHIDFKNNTFLCVSILNSIVYEHFPLHISFLILSISLYVFRWCDKKYLNYDKILVNWLITLLNENLIVHNNQDIEIDGNSKISISFIFRPLLFVSIIDACLWVD